MTALRFYVHEAHGYQIRPGTWESSSSKRRYPHPIGFYVLDSANAHRPVAVFPTGRTWWGPGTKAAGSAERQAIAKTEELNAWDAAELAA